MNREKALCEFIQISDLHFHDSLGGLSAELATPQNESWWGLLPIFDGFLGHHYGGVTDLIDFATARLADNTHPVHLIITGDITRTGGVAQFKLASEIFDQQIGLSGWRELAIPGNHDHWPGNELILGHPAANLDVVLSPCPYLRELHLSTVGKTIQIVGVNSDCDVRPLGLHRLLARGHCLSQLRECRQLLGQWEPDQIRVLLIHHSPSHARRNAYTDDPTLKMGSRSLNELESILFDLDIKIVMTGHIHAPRLDELVVHNEEQSKSVLEACCGTTTQIDRSPAKWAAQLRKFGDKISVNTLIVHELLESSDAIRWRSRIHHRSEQSGFVFDPVAQGARLPATFEAGIEL